ncbi:hypothetical protein BH10CYA1_BH10CYA1_59250 [soil metagenome]
MLQDPFNSNGTNEVGPNLAAQLETGTIVAERYKVEFLIGSGAMGSVYAVEQMFLQKRCALKVLKSLLATDVNVRRFQNEAKAASKLDHPNLVRCVDFGMIDGTVPFLVMDYVDGETLSDVLKRRRLSVQEALDLFIPLAFAMAYAHQEHVVHRDIKPSNILLLNKEKNEPKIGDFGIAKLMENEGQELTKTGEIFGTPLYMSPEQAAGLAADNRTDIYSFGCVMYEALTGAPPFSANTAIETLLKHINQKPLSLREASLGDHFPALLETTIMTMLNKNRDDRPSNFCEVAEKLALIQRGGIESEDNVTPTRSRIKIRYALAVGAIVCSLVVGALVIFKLRAPVAISSKDHSDQNASLNTTLRPSPDIFEGTHEKNNSSLPPNPVVQVQGGRRCFQLGPKAVGRIASLPQLKDLEFYSIREMPLAKDTLSVPAQDKLCFVFDAATLINGGGPSYLRHFAPDLFSALIVDEYTEDPVSGDRTLLDDDVLYMSTFFTNLQFLQLKGPLDSHGLANLGRISTLRYFDYDVSDMEPGEKKAAQLDNETIKRLSWLSRIELLHLRGFSGLSDLLQALPNSHQLENLVLNDDHLNGADFATIAKIKSLKVLGLQGNSGLNDESIKLLSPLQKSLNVLIMAGTLVTPKSIPLIAKFSSADWIAVPNNWSKSDVQRLKDLLRPNVQVTQ